jgi:hypothetical protein
MHIVLVLIIWTFMGLTASHFAKKQNKNPYIWFFIGAFFGVLGLLALFLLPKINKRVSPSEKQSIKRLVTDTNIFFLNKSRESKLWYYVDNNKQQQGPVSFSLLKNKWNNGIINKSTYVWNDEMKDWKKIGTFSSNKKMDKTLKSALPASFDNAGN